MVEKKLDTSVKLCDIWLDNPIIPASGTFGFGYEFAKFYDINMLGTISLKGTTLDARYGNPTPRIAECAEGMLNAVGLQNPGIDKVISEELPKLEKVFEKKAMANIGGFSIEEYVAVAEQFDRDDRIGFLELNVSCPNVHGGGMSFGTNATMLYKVTEAVRLRTRKPLIVKLSPNVTDIKVMAQAVQDAGADGVSLINTLMGMQINLKTRKPLLANKTGGLSGRAIKPVAVRMVYDVFDTIGLPIVGMGGISCAEDVIEFMLAGATAVEIGAENLVNPYACKQIIEDLPRVMEKYGINKLSDIIGGAH